MIRILHIVNSMDQGGLENLIMNIYRNIDRNKIQFDFLTHTLKEGAFYKEILSLGGRIFSVPSRREGIFKNKSSLDTFFKKHPEYKIVHTHLSSLSYIEPLIAATRNDVPIRIVHCHSSREGGMKINQYFHHLNKKRIEKYANIFIAVSNSSAQWMFKDSLLNSGKVKILKNGITLENYEFDEIRRKNNRKKLNIDEETLVVGHVGRFTYAKNHEFLIDIFEEIHKKNANSKLLLVGDGELRMKIEEKLRNKRVDDNTLLTGVTTKVPEYLEIMDIMIFPSRYEGLPLSVVEAQASGLKSIISNNITDEVLITDLAFAMSINNPASEWAKEALKLKSSTRRHLEVNKVKEAGFDIKDTAGKLINIYKSALKDVEEEYL
ncbi:glycosyltransferase family 1 protein [Aerococcus urinaeequi]|uniref:glycosyltransferase family 1 protein n=1 Tax=Aerococcus urinaeequi TaxID=51665 RepID=UPI003D6B7452